MFGSADAVTTEEIAGEMAVLVDPTEARPVLPMVAFRLADGIAAETIEDEDGTVEVAVLAETTVMVRVVVDCAAIIWSMSATMVAKRMVNFIFTIGG